MSVEDELTKRVRMIVRDELKNTLQNLRIEATERLDYGYGGEQIKIIELKLLLGKEEISSTYLDL